MMLTLDHKLSGGLGERGAISRLKQGAGDSADLMLRCHHRIT